MVCDTKLRPRQTAKERVEEVRRVVLKLSAGLANGSIKARIGPQGAIAFAGLGEEDRAGVSDACAYRHLMVSGSALAKLAITRAEVLAGRTVDRKVLAHGVHSHDGGKTWHDGH